jgi:hypothetical protein
MMPATMTLKIVEPAMIVDTSVVETIHARATAANIADHGVRDAMTDCMCARALREATGETWWVGVSYARRISDDKRFLVPSAVQHAIRAWMVGDPIEPFEFDVVEDMDA